MYKNYIFDLYGTLVDIRTNEDKAYLWKKMSEFYGFYEAHYTPAEMRKAYQQYVKEEIELTFKKMKGKKGIKTIEDIVGEVRFDKCILESDTMLAVRRAVNQMIFDKI